MPIVDDHGRLFGRLNLLDAIFALLLVGLIPLAYGIYVMFRTPPPRLIAIEPTTLAKGPNLRVNIRGENLRPYMRVSFGSVQANSFVFRNAGEALVDLNEMEPGVYDVVLYDTAQERSRLPAAFTLLPSPLPASQVTLIGTLGNLTKERAGAVKAGMTLPAVGEVIQVGKPLPESTRVYSAGIVLEIPVDNAVRVPVVVRAGCAVRALQGLPQCVLGDAVLQPTAIITVNTALGTLPLQIDQMRGSQPVEQAQIAVQFTMRSEIEALVRKGDTDHGQWVNELSAGATVIDKSTPLPVGQDFVRADVILRADVQRGENGWIYAASPLRVGSAFVFRTPRYELQGSVVRIDPPWPGAAAAGSTVQ